MANGMLLVVGSMESLKPQTCFVLGKARRRGIKALMVVNKVDMRAVKLGFVIDKYQFG